MDSTALSRAVTHELREMPSAGTSASGLAPVAGVAEGAGVWDGFMAGTGDDVSAGLPVAGISGLCAGRGDGTGVCAGVVGVHATMRVEVTISHAASRRSGGNFNT